MRYALHSSLYPFQFCNKMESATWYLKRRPVGLPVHGDLVYEKSTVSTDLEDGEILAKTLYVSIDPAMRGWMDDVKSYLPPVALGAPMRAGLLVQVLRSKDPRHPVGAFATCLGNMAEYIKCEGSNMASIQVPPSLPPYVFLGVLGITGLTAYFGLFRVGELKSGDEVLVSGAAGATGSIVCQLAKLHGCRVVAICGGPEKVAFLKSLGVDEVIDYKASTNLAKDVKKAMPRGLDVFFDNVGGEILDIAMRLLRKHARVVICGAISMYLADKRPVLNSYLSLLVNNARVQGFTLMNYYHEHAQVRQELLTLLQSGKLKHQEDIVIGLEHGLDALVSEQGIPAKI
eukprot:GEMP01032735.1.p1 GENE.GEMP01032735.1~~GEMP01032735.1.p1  ORF type:complete len:344 (+),score=45.04 GEMP01032735.1:351-1382(+)